MLFSLYIQHRGNCRKGILQKVRKVERERERERDTVNINIDEYL